jgi:flagellar hook-associated protein 1
MPGDNVIANELIKFFYEKTFDNDRNTMTGSYDRFIAKLGIDTQETKEDTVASRIVMSQLQSQRESVSGVSLDEEAANMMKYQHLFTASSRIITTVDDMFKTVLDLKVLLNGW